MNKILKKIFIFCICVVALANSATFTIGADKIRDNYSIYDINANLKGKNKKHAEHVFKINEIKFDDILKSYDITINVGDTIHLVNSDTLTEYVKIKTDTRYGITYTIKRVLKEWKYVIEAVENDTYKIKTIIPPIDTWPIRVDIHESDYVHIYKDIFGFGDDIDGNIKLYNKKTGKLQWQGDCKNYQLENGKIDVRFTGFCYKNDKQTTKSVYPNKCD